MSKKIFIVEDEFTILLDLIKRLELLNYTVVGYALNYADAMEQLPKASPDLVLLDINLKDTFSGIHIADKINSTIKVPFIFLSASSDIITFEEAKKVNPFGFIIKPFKDEDLRNNIELAFEKSKLVSQATIPTDTADTIFVKIKKSYEQINLKNINYIEALDNYCTLHLETEKKIVHTTLKKLHALLPASFIRVHKSFIIPLSQIQSFDNETIILKNKEMIPLGKMYKNELYEKIKFLE